MMTAANLPKSDSASAIHEHYASRRNEFLALESSLQLRFRAAKIAGTLCHWTTLACLILGWIGWLSLAATATGCIAFIAAGLLLTVVNSRMQDRVNRAREMRRINELAIARMDRRWEKIPNIPASLDESSANLAHDLDLFGHASLFDLICSANTSLGIETLRDWLVVPAEPDDIERRQQAVAELSGQLELRQNVDALGRMLAVNASAVQNFSEWASSPSEIHRSACFRWGIRIWSLLPILISSLVLMHFVPETIGMPFLVLVIAINLVMTILFSGAIHDIFAVVTPRSDAALIRQFHRMFQLLPTSKGNSEELRRIRETTAEACTSLRRLQGFAALLNLHRHPWMTVFGYLPLQFLFLWDFHILSLLERWQRKSGHAAPMWFDALGRFEALASFSALSHDNPGWAFPRFANRATPVIQGTAVGHPLLPESTRVSNDVRLGPAGTVLVVTGSNMSGKSTLLRSIGINAVLAQAGGPVCARELIMPPVDVVSSIRITDSLEQAKSLFMAEVLRLKNVVDTARQYSAKSGRVLLYLLDEILQGTNTAERHVAVLRVLKHLLSQQAIGAISTHDLELAANSELAPHVQNVHFRETLFDPDDDLSMSFDYMMRPGIATSTNALKLLDFVGLTP